MHNRTIAFLLPFLLLMTGIIGSASVAETTPASHEHARTAVVNPFDPTTWMHTNPTTLPFNFAHPAGWAVFIDPRTHASAHAALMNPATYSQFMQPQFWMQFANPNNMMAWMNPASYATFMNPATYLGWMRQEPYMHFIDPSMYMQMFNPGAYATLMNPTIYMQWMNPAAYAIPAGVAQGGVATFNWFDPNTWMRTTTAIMPPQERKQ